MTTALAQPRPVFGTTLDVPEGIELEAHVVYVDLSGRHSSPVKYQRCYAEDYCGPYGAYVWEPQWPETTYYVQQFPFADMARAAEAALL